jgi:hypothetical protein
MEIAHEPLHLDNWSLLQWKIKDIPTSFIWIIILFNNAFKYGDGATYWYYVRTTAELFCGEFCNFV